MNKLFIGLLMATFSFAWFVSCTNTSDGEKTTLADTAYMINGTIKGLDSAVVLLSYRIGEDRKIDSAKVLKGAFAFNGKTTEPRKASLRVLGDENYDELSFYVDNGKIEILAVKDSLSKGVAKGTKVNEEHALLKDIMKAQDQKLEALIAMYQKADRSNKKLMDSLDNAYERIDKETKETTLKFVSDHPSSFVSAYEIMNMFSYNPDVPKFDSAFNSLDSIVKASSVGNRLLAKLEIAKKTDINQLAPDFTLNDVNGKPVSLASLRGKFILIDFWASWCGPCRAENPNLVKTHKAFNKKGFDVLGVSLDTEEDKDKWLEAIKKDKLTWTQVSDLKGWQSDVGKLYGIAGIPMNFLLDKDGKIIAKGLRGESLDKKLAEVLN